MKFSHLSSSVLQAKPTPLVWASMVAAAALPSMSSAATPVPAAAVASNTGKAGPSVEVMNSQTALPASLRQLAESSQMTLRVREGNLLQLPRAAAKVLVADPKVASFQMPSPTSLFVFADSVGSTTLYVLDANDVVIAAVKVVAEHNLAPLREQILRSVPGARIELEPAINNRILVRGAVKTPLEAKQVVDQVQAFLDASASGAGGAPGGANSKNSGVINQLKVEQSSQINIQVRVVEVSRSLSHELGFSWAGVFNGSTLGVGNASGIFTANAAGGAMSTLMPSTVTGGAAIAGPNGLLSALSSQGMATVLAEPNLTAMSGESAAFAAGGEVPIVIITANNVQIDFKSFGVILRMTPTLLSANRISLHIAPEVSELSSEGAVTLSGGTTIPAFKVRRADTTVELASGQSFALAGMLRSTSSQEVSGVPGLSSIPLIGRLFEREATKSQETELVILVTANVVDPVSMSELRVPGQGLRSIDALVPKQSAAGYLY
ncbi:type II and III secretion system protein family protein [Curvibacter sp. CHRR-16]|uniref:type II and III secretion system protein family protein n=1 Tax=Curvibacter sp. CHRR-16 TaxID=2835872 RepID=UPI001BD98185|nr:type II and III secretion system protein family protein [Curvibacter sp. CHRR-16]MBT0570736.1 type II and III secretion system protein family protein [Curvibacter sp. CHRR-16]